MHATFANHSHIHRARRATRPIKWLVQALATRHQRMRLDQLDDHLLRDIGIDRRTAYWEAHRPFWDRP
jgi:uncharacterized protein YjiS (DUF1127 family)